MEWQSLELVVTSYFLLGDLSLHRIVPFLSSPISEWPFITLILPKAN